MIIHEVSSYIRFNVDSKQNNGPLSLNVHQLILRDVSQRAILDPRPRPSDTPSITLIIVLIPSTDYI